MYEIAQMLATAFAIGLTGALAPGPTLLATVNSSLQEGWRAGPKVAAGHALVEVLIFLIIVGGLALIAFGVMTAIGSRRAVLKGPEGKASGSAFLAGAVTSAANPYFWIWWLSVGSAFLLTGLNSGLIMAAAFIVGHWGADFGWYTLVSGSLDRGRSVLSQASYRGILGICGLFLICFGIYFLSQA